MAAVDKIKDKRKPEDFIGHRNRTPVRTLVRNGKNDTAATIAIFPLVFLIM